MGKKGKSKYNGMFIKGQKFGRYTVINASIIIEREAKVECQCDCGVVRKVSCYTLIKGTSTQCLDCGNSMEKEKNPAWRGYGKIPGKVISQIKRNANIRGIEFNLNLEYLDKLYKDQKFKCSLTGLDLTENDFSLDRINSNIGYVKNNVQWVHKDVNMMKKDYNQDYFINICKLITKNYGK
jgi:hypothetical protein